MIKILFTETLGNLLAVLAGIVAFRRLPAGMRLLFYYVVLAWLVEWAGAFITGYLKANNVLLYNLAMIPFFLLLAASGYRLFFPERPRKLYFIAAAIFIVIVVVSIYISGKGHLALVAITVYNAFNMVLFTMGLYKSVVWSGKPLFRLPEFWITLGIILFSACSVPFFAFFNKVMRIFTGEQLTILHLVLVGLSNFMYICIAWGFLLKFLEKHDKPD